MKIEIQGKGAFFGRRRGDALIRAMNSLLNMRVEFVDENKSAEVLVSDANTVIKIPKGAGGGGGGGGIPAGYEPVEVDFIDKVTNKPVSGMMLVKLDSVPPTPPEDNEDE